LGSEANQFLEDATRGGHEAVKFKAVGDAISGTIIDDPKPVTRKNLNDGSPEDQLPVNIDTDQGPRTIWIRRGFLASAVQDAVKEAGATGLQVGGKLAVKLIELRDTGKPMPAKVFKAKYEAPVSSGANLEEIF
jgi:hypothetical protein